jgi:hypothetical protein
MQRLLEKVEQRRSQPVTEADIQQILAGLQSADEVTRASAVRQICPCRMPWEVFDRLRKAAKSLQKDPSPLVRANALHIEQDAREVASMEALNERLQEREDAEDTPQPNQRGRQRRRR